MSGVQVHRSKTERIEIAKQILEKYSEGEFTIESCCAAFGIPYRTFANWAAPEVDNVEELPLDAQILLKNRGYVAEVAALYKEGKKLADTNFSLLLRNAGRQAILKRVKGYEVEELHTEMKVDEHGNATPASVKKVTKHIAPDPTLVIFALKNVDKGTFTDTRIVKTEAHISSQRKRLSDMDMPELEREYERIRAEYENIQEIEYEVVSTNTESNAGTGDATASAE